MIITIDGPSGSGKSTLALNLAHKLHFFCLNSGYIYRGIAYILKSFYQYDQLSIQHVNALEVQDFLHGGKFQYSYENDVAKIYWADINITPFLKAIDISEFAAILAQQESIRLQVRTFERSLAKNRDIVIEGRSCGSVVFPHAEIKFFLDASLSIRSRRLQADQQKIGKFISMDEAFNQVEQRDRMDRLRDVEPLIVPIGAIMLDSSINNAQEITEQALEIIRNYLKK